MKKFIQSPWGAATVTAAFFLVIMGGVAVMAKSMIDSRFKEASKSQNKGHDDDHGAEHAKGHDDDHGAEHAKGHDDDHGAEHAKGHDDDHGAEHAKGNETEPNAQTNTDLHLTVPKAPHGNPSADPSNINTITIEAPAGQPHHPDDEHSNESHDAHGEESHTEHKADADHGKEEHTTDSSHAESHGNEADAISHGEAPHWTYEGETGPFTWHKMNADWAIAEAGIRQSPIDIIPERTLTLPTLKPIEFHYSGGLHLLMDNGHTIQVDIKNDENYIVINGQKYELLQFHFHAKSEHTLNGHAAKMEVHLVHKLVTEAPYGGSCVPAPEDGHKEKSKAPQVQLAVIGVMIEPGSEAHPFIKDLWSDLNAVKPNDGGIRFRLDGPLSLVPPKGKRSYYRYNGSLTTPPCSENVLWTVMSEPIHFSAAQIKVFTDRYSNNARPVMKKARRFVLKYEDKPTDFTPAVLVPSPAPELLPNTIPVPLTNAPSIGVRGGIGLPKLPITPGTVPTPQPR
jgi:carbonic anhydrase